MKKTILYIIISLALLSCNSTKNIPDGQYLLSDVSIKVDSGKIDATYYEDFVRQYPTSALRLAIYNMAGDTSKWINRQIQKAGKAPTIYNPRQTKIGADQITKQLSNQGYLRATVDTLLKSKNKKMEVTYYIRSGEPYTIRKYEYKINNKNIARNLSVAKKYTSIKPGIIFNQENIEGSRENLTTYLRNIGYYKFSKEYLYFKADTTLNSHQVDLTLSLYESKDSTSFQRFKIRNVSILTGFDAMSRGNENLFSLPDTVDYNGIKIIYGKNNFLRKSVIYKNNYIKPGKFYGERAFTNTVGAFNGIGVVKQTDISFTPIINVSDTIQHVDAFITIAPGNTHFFQTEIQGTNSAGDLGIAPSATYQHNNLLNGAEILKLKVRGAYEFVPKTKNTNSKNENYYEFGSDLSLAFPEFLFPWLKPSWRDLPSASTQFAVGINSQHRKDYTRQFFNATLTYRWTTQNSRFSHSLDLWDINYIRMPWVSAGFWELYLSDKANPMTRASYQDQLISRLNYNVTFTNSAGLVSSRFMPKNVVTIRGGIDYSGLLPRLVTSFYKPKVNAEDQKQIVGIAYAEYIKGDISYAQTHTMDKKNKFAFRIGLGVASPFGNSKVLPFETRYFAGGANSVRGWSTRSLGPGSYSPDNDSTNFVNQVGDIKLDLNVEYRKKMTDLFEIAAFVDAGNVWTIRDYSESQPNGQFKLSKFYKEIALAYGTGLRIDLGFLLLRLDLGARAYDPGKKENQRWVILKPTFSKMAWHFAIGYPF